MYNKKLISCVMTGILSVGIIGGIGPSAFADTSQESDKEKVSADFSTKKEKFQKIKDELNALGVSPHSQAEKDDYIENLDADTRRKIEEMIDKIKANKLTSDETKEIRRQRIHIPKQETDDKRFAELDEEAKVIMEMLEKVTAGKMTKDEAIEKLKKLNINLPSLEMLKPLSHLDGEARTRAEAIYKKRMDGTISKEEAAVEIRKLRVKLPTKSKKDEERIDQTNLDKGNLEVRPPRR
ncbi:hypothetical protein KDN24_08480 [Bacillus sp. Bva_UNVM-123]|uniref:hypothetical protein n=1 Tax=Bacillus sp. Bva_UNVM-123 TaxID=2829798 RepID=UPI00391F21C5